MSARDLAPTPYTVDGDHGTIADANGNSVLRFALRLLGDDSWREIAAECAVAHEMREALTELEKYVVDVLTGSIMQKAGVIWPEGGPKGPVLQKARAALAKASAQ